MCAAGMDKEYRQKVRSLSYNLSDASNPELRARVLQGEVTPDQLVQMSPNELASKVPPQDSSKNPWLCKSKIILYLIYSLYNLQYSSTEFMTLDDACVVAVTNA